MCICMKMYTRIHRPSSHVSNFFIHTRLQKRNQTFPGGWCDSIRPGTRPALQLKGLRNVVIFMQRFLFWTKRGFDRILCFASGLHVLGYCVRGGRGCCKETISRTASTTVSSGCRQRQSSADVDAAQTAARRPA